MMVGTRPTVKTNISEAFSSRHHRGAISRHIPLLTPFQLPHFLLHLPLQSARILTSRTISALLSQHTTQPEATSLCVHILRWQHLEQMARGKSHPRPQAEICWYSSPVLRPSSRPLHRPWGMAKSLACRLLPVSPGSTPIIDWGRSERWGNHIEPEERTTTSLVSYAVRGPCQLKRPEEKRSKENMAGKGSRSHAQVLALALTCSLSDFQSLLTAFF